MPRTQPTLLIEPLWWLQNFDYFSQGMSREVQEGVAPSVEQLRSSQAEDAIDERVGGNAQEGSGPAEVGDGMVLQDMSQRPLRLQNLFPRSQGEQVEGNSDRPEFNRQPGAFQLQDDFANVVLTLSFLTQHPQMNTASMKGLECGRHVFLMDEQAFVRLGHGLAVDLLQRRQTRVPPRIKLIQRMSH